jgi:hypothetical protein
VLLLEPELLQLVPVQLQEQALGPVLEQEPVQGLEQELPPLQ